VQGNQRGAGAPLMPHPFPKPGILHKLWGGPLGGPPVFYMGANFKAGHSWLVSSPRGDHGNTAEKSGGRQQV